MHRVRGVDVRAHDRRAHNRVTGCGGGARNVDRFENLVDQPEAVSDVIRVCILAHDGVSVVDTPSNGGLGARHVDHRVSACLKQVAMGGHYVVIVQRVPSAHDIRRPGVDAGGEAQDRIRRVDRGVGNKYLLKAVDHVGTIGVRPHDPGAAVIDAERYRALAPREKDRPGAGEDAPARAGPWIQTTSPVGVRDAEELVAIAIRSGKYRT